MNSHRKVYINITRLFWIIIIALFIKPGYFDTIPALDIIFTAARIAIFFVLVIRLFLVRKQYSKIIFLTAAYAGCQILVTAIYAGDIFSSIKNASIIFGSVLLMEYMEEKRHIKMVYDLCLVMEIFIYINLATILLFPEGLWTVTTDFNWSSDAFWFFGLRNVHPHFLMFGCFLSTVTLHLSNKKFRDTIRCIMLHAVSAITIVMLDSGAGYVMMIAYVLLVIAFHFFVKKRLPFNLVVFFHVILFFAISVFSVTIKFSRLFIFFGKEGTATGRLLIWHEVWQRIMERPILGYGNMKINDWRWLQQIAAGATTGHNTMIDIILRGGFVTFIIFVVLLLMVGNNLKRCSSDIFLYNLASISFASFFLSLQTEGASAGVGLFMMLGFLWSLSSIYEKYNAEQVLQGVADNIILKASYIKN